MAKHFFTTRYIWFFIQKIIYLTRSLNYIAQGCMILRGRSLRCGRTSRARQHEGEGGARDAGAPPGCVAAAAGTASGRTTATAGTEGVGFTAAASADGTGSAAAATPAGPRPRATEPVPTCTAAFGLPRRGNSNKHHITLHC